MRDPTLEDTLRRDLEDQDGLTETPTFGGLALRGHPLACARHDGMLARPGKGRDGWAPAPPGAEPLLSGARLMHGWVRLPPGLAADPDLRARVLAAALDFVRGLPPK